MDRSRDPSTNVSTEEAAKVEATTVASTTTTISAAAKVEVPTGTSTSVSQLKRGTNQHEEKVDGSREPSTNVSTGEAAKRENVGRESVKRAKTVLSKGIPELQQAVDDRKVTVKAAAQIAKLTPAEQRKCIENEFQLPKKPKPVEQTPVEFRMRLPRL